LRGNVKRRGGWAALISIEINPVSANLLETLERAIVLVESFS
jgi:hypothetical protein